MKREDAQVAAAAAKLTKIMKRLFAIAVMLLMLTACAPDNIITVPEIPDDTTTDDVPTNDVPQTDNKVENTVPDNTVDEQPPATEPEPEPKPEPQPQVKVELLTEGKQANTEIAPTYTLAEDTSLLNGKTINMYTGYESAFMAGNLTEKQWFDGLKDKYGVTVKYSYQNDNILYSAQNIAMRSGMALDIVTARINDMAASLGLMRSAEGFLKETGTPYYSQNVFKSSGNKVFTGIGNSRMLWYNVDLYGEDKFYGLFNENKWTADVLSSTQYSLADTDVRLIECSNWISFGSTGENQVTGILDGAHTVTVTAEGSRNAFNKFGTIVSKDSHKPTASFNFNSNNTLFKFTDDPGDMSFKLSFVPVPKCDDNGRDVAEICGIGLGIAKTATDDMAQTAAIFASLWSARYTESRADRLMALLGLEKAEKYLYFTESNGIISNADRQISHLFDGDIILAYLYADEDSVYNSCVSAYNRSKLINARNR